MKQTKQYKRWFTPFMLTKEEREFLSELGFGSMVSGLRNLIRTAMERMKNENK